MELFVDQSFHIHAVNDFLSDVASLIKRAAFLIETKLASRKAITAALARQFDMPFVSLEKVTVKDEIINSVPRAVAEENVIMPVKKNGKSITILFLASRRLNGRTSCLMMMEVLLLPSKMLLED